MCLLFATLKQFAKMIHQGGIPAAITRWRKFYHLKMIFPVIIGKHYIKRDKCTRNLTINTIHVIKCKHPQTKIDGDKKHFDEDKKEHDWPKACARKEDIFIEPLCAYICVRVYEPQRSWIRPLWQVRHK